MQLNIHAQIDPKKLDSLSRSIDSSSKARKSWQDSFTKVQDSVYHAATSKDIKNNSHHSDQSFAEEKRKRAKERQQTILRIVTGAVLLVIGIIALIRRRKTKT
ncbi:MAG TPA: hypothetical protein VL095_06155 [Flavisolibacter sp.]|nr:hypothetical protein [Flavisolibacter sp.]